MRDFFYRLTPFLSRDQQGQSRASYKTWFKNSTTFQRLSRTKTGHFLKDEISNWHTTGISQETNSADALCLTAVLHPHYNLVKNSKTWCKGFDNWVFKHWNSKLEDFVHVHSGTCFVFKDFQGFLKDHVNREQVSKGAIGAMVSPQWHNLFFLHCAEKVEPGSTSVPIVLSISTRVRYKIRSAGAAREAVWPQPSTFFTTTDRGNVAGSAALAGVWALRILIVIIINPWLDTLESQRQHLSEQFFRRSVLRESSCLQLPAAGQTGLNHHRQTTSCENIYIIPH